MFEKYQAISDKMCSLYSPTPLYPACASCTCGLFFPMSILKFFNIKNKKIKEEMISHWIIIPPKLVPFAWEKKKKTRGLLGGGREQCETSDRVPLGWAAILLMHDQCLGPIIHSWPPLNIIQDHNNKDIEDERGMLGTVIVKFYTFCFVWLNLDE